MKILMIGDIVGEPGRRAVREGIESLRGREQIDFVIANGENAAGGSGITPKIPTWLICSNPNEDELRMIQQTFHIPSYPFPHVCAGWFEPDPDSQH